MDQRRGDEVSLLAELCLQLADICSVGDGGELDIRSHFQEFS
jgi:hypothetical protein